MGAISAANANALTDKLAAQWNFMLGVSGGNGLGDGTFGSSSKQAALATIIAALNDIVLEAIGAPLVQNFPSYTAASQFKQQNQSVLTVLNGLGVASNALGASVVDWDSLLYFYNVLNGPFGWAALAAPDYRAAMMALGVTPNQLNVYLEVLTGATWQGNTFTNALRKASIVASVNTQTPGYAIDFTKFAGGFPFLNVVSITGSGVVTAVGTNQSGAAENFTVNASAPGRVALVPGTVSTDLITTCTGLTAAAGITAMVAYVEANRPAGRTNPPV